MKNTGFTVSSIDMASRRKIDFQAGDTVRVWQKIIEKVAEKDAAKKTKVKVKTRLQAFEGIVLARKHGDDDGATFTVRKMIDSVGVERIFPLYSPAIDTIEVLRRSKVRRAKLYFIRRKAAKEIRRQMSRERAHTPVVEVVSEPVSNESTPEATPAVA